MDVSKAMSAAPWSDYDPYTDEALLDPWPGYRQLRDAGPAVWLPQYEMFALTRQDSVRRVLVDWESFPSRNGVMMNEQMNQVLRSNTLCSDGADHDALAVAILNDYDIRVVKTKGEFTRHSHPDADEFCLVLSGCLTLRIESGDVDLRPGQLYVVPRGVPHQPVSAEGAEVMLIEPSSTVNTGDTPSELSRIELSSKP